MEIFLSRVTQILRYQNSLQSTPRQVAGCFIQETAVFSCLREQLARDLCDMLPLELGCIEFVCAGHPASVSAGNRGGAVGRSPGYLIGARLPLKRIGQADDDHALVQQGRVEAQDRRFLAAVLGAGAGEHASHLADQGALGPEAARRK
jgi:hypothetical protein